ncbi:nuclear pore complex protein Nup50 isoform X2 [Colias croceus]|uniref:nuclear pore complex protein Nup50 isoform X2 n=1 Tax=Colias crocea TaxID=72248 RepID=UPI001E27D0A0|nr:nuclear pore complex protein Nup50 isoform X2 [Colias croceus]
MSVKRAATTELNHDNWDQEDSNEPEDTEGFKMAPKEVLEKRVIRTAKRRSNIGNNEGQKSVFSGFGGFNKTQKTSFDFLANLTNGNKANTSLSSPSVTEGSSSLFSSKPFTTSASSSGFTALGSSAPVTSSTNQSSLFGKSTTTSPTGIKFPQTDTKLDSKEAQSESPFKIQTTSTPLSTFSFASKSSPTPAPKSSPSSAPTANVSSNVFTSSSSSPFKMSSTGPNFNMPTAKKDKPIENKISPEKKDSRETKESGGDKDEIDERKLNYYKNIQGLNVSVSEWIEKHVKETPICILSPIFKDYEKHLKDIQDEYFNNKESKSGGEKGDFKQNVNSEKKSTPTGSSLFSSTSTTNRNTLVTEKTSNIFGTPTSNNKQDTTTGTTGFSFGIASKTPTATTTSGFSLGNVSTTTSGFSFGNVSKTPTTTTTSGFSLGNVSKTSTTTTTSGFSLGNVSKTSTTTTTSGFSLGNVSKTPTTTTISGFSLGNVSKTLTTTTTSGFSLGNVSKTPTTTSTSNTDQTPKKSTGFSFGTNSTTISTPGLPAITTTKTGFSFGMNSTSQSSSLFSGTSTGTITNGNSTFSFGAGKPFSFNSNIQKKEEETTQSNNNEDEDQPPKVEFTPLVEENSVFDKKCKVFFKKDGNFVDKGVCTLYIKKIEESGKHQLLVRANTTLGTVLLNMILSASIPTQRMGKNNVMLVCIPTPDAKPPPTPVLIRVKTSEEADDLLEILNKYKM